MADPTLADVLMQRNALAPRSERVGIWPEMDQEALARLSNTLHGINRLGPPGYNPGPRASANVDDRRDARPPWLSPLLHNIGMERTGQLINSVGLGSLDHQIYPYDPAILPGPREGSVPPPQPMPQESLSPPHDSVPMPHQAGSPEIIASSLDKALAMQMGVAQPSWFERWVMNPLGGHWPLTPGERRHLEPHRLPGGVGNAPY